MSNGNEVSYEEFEQFLKDLNHRVWEVRRDACERLGEIGDPRAVDALIFALQDGVGAVRFAAAGALGKLGDPIAIPALLTLLESNEFGTHGPVIEALTELGTDREGPSRNVCHIVDIRECGSFNKILCHR